MKQQELYLDHTWKREPKLLGRVVGESKINEAKIFALAMGHSHAEYTLLAALRRALTTHKMRTFTLRDLRKGRGARFVALVTNLQRRGDVVNLALRIIGEAP